MTVTARAYAKINLLLNVTGKEEGGMHTVQNVMQSVSLGDIVSVKFLDDGGIRATSNLTELGGKQDITYKAAKLYAEQAHIELNADIDVKKNIPVAAGLGGGSADAAAVLMILEKQFGALGSEKLRGLAAELGADVPFFLDGGALLCTHYGEKTEHIGCMPPCSIVIAKTGEKPSTGMMYSLIDGIELPPFNPSAYDIVDAIEEGTVSDIAEKCGNVFEYVWHDSAMEDVKKTMRRTGALTVHLSGSGPCVFGIYDSPVKATACLKALRNSSVASWICEPIKKAVFLD